MTSPIEVGFAALDAAGCEDELVLVKAKCLLRGYVSRWTEDMRHWKLRAVEQTLKSPIVNPKTGRTLRNYTFAGKVDKLVQMPGGGHWLVDHKTTSSMDRVEDQLPILSQPMAYRMLSWANGVQVRGAVWDMVKKPGISPKRVSQANCDLIRDTGQYYGQTVSTPGLLSSVIGCSDPVIESPELYGYRLDADIRENSDRYFKRHIVTHSHAEMMTYLEELNDAAADINESLKRANKTGRVPYKNTAACFNFGTPCTYLGICTGSDTPYSNTWTSGPVHPELDDTVGLTVLTNSRLGCFATCRAKHHYRYELGLTRDTESPALYFGTLWHTAMDAVWSVLCEEE